MRTPWLATFALAALSSSAFAAGDPNEAKIRDALVAFAPGVKLDKVSASEVPGLYEVVTSGAVVYVTSDGKYLVKGEVVELGSKREITEERMAAIRAESLNSMPDSKAIVYQAKHQKHEVTVFTDIDCGYCRKLHAHMTEYNDRGITVKYLFFPRSGLGSESYKKAVSVWCAGDRLKALTDAKAGKDLEGKTCDNPIAEEFQLGMKMGVAGTPAVYAENGTHIGGYVTPDALATRLDAIKPVAAAAK